MHLSLMSIAGGAVLVAALAAGAAGRGGAVQSGAPAAQPAGVLRHLGRTELPGYTGGFDRFDADVKGNRLFLAAQERGTLEVFELSSGRHLKSVRGFDTPHKALYLPDRQRIVVIDSGAGHSKMIDSTAYKVLDTIKLQPGADAMTYDPSGRMMYVVSGGKKGKMTRSYLSKVNPRTGQKLDEIAFDADQLEAIAVEQNGPNLYVNVTGHNFVAVINKIKFTMVDKWTVTGAQVNAPIALDEAGHRLFVVTRQPFKVMVIDTTSGNTVASFDAPDGSNEIMFDSRSRRIYLAGDNCIGVFQQHDPDHYAELERVPTGPGARTAILVPELNQMFVAQPAGEAGASAALLRFDVQSTAGLAVAVK